MHADLRTGVGLNGLNVPDAVVTRGRMHKQTENRGGLVVLATNLWGHAVVVWRSHQPGAEETRAGRTMSSLRRSCIAHGAQPVPHRDLEIDPSVRPAHGESSGGCCASQQLLCCTRMVSSPVVAAAHVTFAASAEVSRVSHLHVACCIKARLNSQRHKAHEICRSTSACRIR
jgi:hypothetical protein